MSQLSVNNLSLALAFALVLVAVYISNREKLGLTKDIFYSISRAIVQLVIVGYILKYIFNVNNVILTAAMSFFIVLNAAYNAHKRNPNDHKSYFNSLLAIFVSTYVTMGVLVASGSIRFIPSQIVPISGMIASNSMVAIGLCYRNLNTLFKNRIYFIILHHLRQPLSSHPICKEIGFIKIITLKGDCVFSFFPTHLSEKYRFALTQNNRLPKRGKPFSKPFFQNATDHRRKFFHWSKI